MKKLLTYILWIFTALWLAYAGLTVYDSLVVDWDVYLTNLPIDWMYTSLCINDSWQVFKHELARVSAYISWTANLTTTLADTCYPVPWPFVNNVIDGFITSGDSIVYQWQQTLFKILYSTAVESDTVNTIVQMGVRNNGALIQWCTSMTKLESNTAIQTASSVCTVELSSWDIVQLTASSDKAWAVITFDNYSSIAERF